MFKIIMEECIMPIVPILYFMMRNEAIFKKNVVVRVTLPYEDRTDNYIQGRCRSYHNRFLQTGKVMF